MSFEFIKKLPTPEEIRNQYPLDAELQARNAMLRFATFSPENPINSSLSSDHVLQITKMPYAIIF